MPSFYNSNAALWPVLFTFAQGTMALPTASHILKREMTSGAKAGLGIGIAVLVIIVVLVSVFFFVHMRRRAHNKAINNERAVLAGEKNTDGSDKFDKFAPEPERPGIRRNKSVKDRLMGPLYRGSMIDLPPMPNRARLGGNNSNRQSTMTVGNESFLNKPWAASESSPRPSFSSKRATRMMMMM